MLGLGLILLSLVVNISKDGQVALGLVLEEGVVQHRVLDINLAQLRVHPFLHLLPHHLRAVPLAEWVSQLADASCFDEFRQFEHWFEDASFGLQEFRLLVPMSGHWDGVFQCF